MTPRRPLSIAELPPGIEHGIWTPVPVPPPKKKLRLRFKEAAKDEAKAIAQRGTMSFHMAGCSGNHEYHRPQASVAAAMGRQVEKPGIWGGNKNAPAASFFYHLGDLIYKGDLPEDHTRNRQPTLYEEQFYEPYGDYRRPVFAIPGNHDGKHNEEPKKSPIDHFLGNFCTSLMPQMADAERHGRAASDQPYPYWVLDTPAAYIIGLYGNVVNAGQLDDPMGKTTPQYDWLVRVLTRIRRKKNARAVILAVHYPPYSGARDFTVRGDPNAGPTPRRQPMQPLAVILERAFKESKLRPDIIVSAHAHHYQRITYRYADGCELPCLIAGTGGHTDLEPLTRTPSGKNLALPRLPCPTVLPPGFTLPKGDRAQLVAYEYEQPGFLRITVDAKKERLTAEFFRVPCFGDDAKAKPALFDSCTLDLKRHRLIDA